MKYDCTEKELYFIENAEIKDGGSNPYICVLYEDEYHYLSTCGTILTMEDDTEVSSLYYINEKRAKDALDKFKNNREISAGGKRKKSPLKPVKRMSAEEFAGALKNI